MKRSEINAILRTNTAFLQEMHFLLPPFAWWSPEEWAAKGPECREIVACGLGWDITDFGGDDYDSLGLFLFTVRNGRMEDLNRLGGKSYAEKIMIVQEGQLTPTHFHFNKMEDIINRGGGNLLMRVWNATPEASLGDTAVTLCKDGVRVVIPAGGELTLKPGESVTLPQFVYHRFWGEPGMGTVMVGEVSQVNDDHTDNRFYDPMGRFPSIEEDEAPLHLLVNDYPHYYRYC